MKTIIILIIILVIIFGIVGWLYYLNYSDVDDAGADEEEEGKEISDNDCIKLGCPVGSIYAGSINSDKYYECECRWARNINPENLVCFKTDEEAVSDRRIKSEC